MELWGLSLETIQDAMLDLLGGLIRSSSHVQDVDTILINLDAFCAENAIGACALIVLIES